MSVGEYRIGDMGFVLSLPVSTRRAIAEELDIMIKEAAKRANKAKSPSGRRGTRTPPSRGRRGRRR